MSRPTTIPITCSACEHAQDFTVWQSLNVTLDPARKAELLDGSLLQFTCGRCGRTAEVVYPLLYHDMGRRLMLWLLPDGEEPEAQEQLIAPIGGELAPGYVRRRVASRNELVEKVFAFDAGLDDRVIECVKLILSTQVPPEKAPPGTPILFTRLVDEGDGPRLAFTLLAADGPAGFSVPRNPLYEGCERDFVADEPQPAGWAIVDLAWAIERVGRRGDPSVGEEGLGAEPRPWWQTWREKPPLN